MTFSTFHSHEEVGVKKSQGQSSLMPAFVNKVLLAQDHVHFLHIACDCFHSITVKLSSWNRDSMVCKAKNIDSLALYKRSSLTRILYSDWHIVRVQKMYHGQADSFPWDLVSPMLKWTYENNFTKSSHSLAVVHGLWLVDKIQCIILPLLLLAIHSGCHLI